MDHRLKSRATSIFKHVQLPLILTVLVHGYTVCTKFHGNLLNIRQDFSPKTQDVHHMVALEKKSGITNISRKSSSGNTESQKKKNVMAGHQIVFLILQSGTNNRQSDTATCGASAGTKKNQCFLHVLTPYLHCIV